MKRSNQGVELKQNQYFIDGVPFFVYSGEMHYFRISASAWEDRLKKAKQIGLNTVSSYIPWNWHEPLEGQIDFTGQTHPQRNLIRFLNLVQKLGLKFIARPGPVTHGENKNEGLPQWLVDKPGGISIRDSAGQPSWCPWLPSFYQPLYQEKVTSWYNAVLPILKKYQAQQGGPVIQIQLDNEIHMMNWLGKLADYSETTTQRYQEFLKKKYGSIAALNTAYQATYINFQEIKQPAGLAGQEAWLWLWDWALYYRDHYAGYFRFLANLVQKHGLRTALSANIAQFVDCHMYGRGWESIANTNVFRDFSLQVPPTIFGGAFQMRHLDFENFHDIIFCVAAMRSITLPGIPVNCAELQVGVINDRPRIYSSDVELNLKTAVAQGLNGVNGYMMFGGWSPDDIQLRGSYHEWQAPVDAQGDWRDHVEPLKRFGQFIRLFGKQLSPTQPPWDLTLAYDPHYYFTEFIKNDFYSRLQRERNQHFFDGSARVLTLLGFQTELLDLARASQEELQSRPFLWLFSLDFMHRSIMEKLVAYVQAGGKLIINPGIPVKDVTMQTDNYLVEQLGLKVEKVEPMTARNYYRQNDHLYFVESDMTLFQETGPEEVWLRDAQGRACCLHRRVGKGEVLAIGFGLNHQYDYIVNLVQAFTQQIGLQPLLQKDTWEVHANLRLQGDQGWLYVANFQDRPRSLALKFYWPNSRKLHRFPAQGRIELPNRSAYFFPLNIPLGQDLILVESTCEVLDFKRRLRPPTMEFLVRGVGCQPAAMSLITPHPIRQAWVDDKKIKVETTRRLTKVRFLSQGHIQKLSLKYS